MSFSHENLIRLTTPDTTTKCFRSMLWCAILSRQRCVFWRDTISVSFSFDNYTKHIAIATKLDYYYKMLVYFQSIQRWFGLKPIKVGRRYFTLRMWEKLEKTSRLELVWDSAQYFKYVKNWNSESISIFICFNSFSIGRIPSYISSSLYLWFDTKLYHRKNIHVIYNEPRIMRNFLLLLSKYQIHMLPKNGSDILISLLKRIEWESQCRQRKHTYMEKHNSIVADGDKSNEPFQEKPPAKIFWNV